MKLLLSTVAIAALFSASPVKADPWTGPYLGLNAGYAWGDASTKDNAKDGVAPGPFDYKASGFVGGAQAGYNWQVQNFVVGVEADLGYLGLDGNGIIGSAHADHHQDLTLNGGLYGDVTGRVGVVIDGSTLVYVKGGFAFFNGEASQATTADGYQSHGTDTFTGYVVGGGVEKFVTQNISLKLEYQHFDFGSQGGDQTNVGDTSSPIGYKFRNETSLTADTVKLGLNYHF